MVSKQNGVLISILLILSGCLSLVSDYDIHTYRSLTELKGEMKVAFSGFAEKGASGADDGKTLTRFLIRISQAQEYEAGKKLNDDTSAQLDVLEKTIYELVQRFTENNSALSRGYCEAKWMVLKKAVDMAIETERNKIKTK